MLTHTNTSNSVTVAFSDRRFPHYLVRVIWLMVIIAFSMLVKTGATELRGWSIHITSPSLYPVSVTEAYGQHVNDNWKVSTGRYASLGRKTQLQHLRSNGDFEDYDGYGLNVSVNAWSTGRQGTSRRKIELPGKLIVHWYSHINSVSYVTEYPVSAALKNFMDKPSTLSSNNTSKCYYRQFLLGLLPDGRAKLFVVGCGAYKYVEEILPTQILHDEGAKIPKEQNWAFKRAKEAGVEALPIPWDKVNKVYMLDKPGHEKTNDWLVEFTKNQERSWFDKVFGKEE